MKKVVCVVVLLSVVFISVYSEDIIYIVTRETPLFNFNNGSVIRILAKGEELRYGDYETHKGFQQYEIRVITGQEEKGMVNLNDILSEGSQILPESVTSKQWIYSFYQDILFEQDREALFKHETFWRDDYEKTMEREPAFWDTYWWENFYPTYFDIRNNIISIGELFWDDLIYFALTQQYQNGDTTVVKAVCTAKKGDFPENPINKLFEEGSEYTIILKCDGDYMDFYVGDENNKVCTLIGVDKQFIDSIVGVVRGENVDLAQLTWPRRADGSMDYPPPGTKATTVPKQPETVAIDTPAGDEDTATVTPAEGTVVQQPGTALPLVIVLAVAGIAVVAGVAVFLMRRKRLTRSVN
jgi:hypothetical protein